MNRTATADPDTLAGILVLISAIERRIDTDAAVLGFRAALRRRGAEAMTAGGSDLIETLMREVAEADPDRADARTALLRSAWADLPPAPAGRARP